MSLIYPRLSTLRLQRRNRCFGFLKECTSGLRNRTIMAAVSPMQEDAKGEAIRIRNSKYEKGVQYLVESGITQVPDVYIQPEKRRPHLIPVVDFSGLKQQHRRRQVIDQVRKASTTYGFFQVINHDVPVRVLERMIDVVRRFHELPTDEKMVYHSDDPYKNLRFQTIFNKEKQEVLEWRDSLEQRCYPPPEDDDWPKIPSDYRDVVTEYSKEVRQLTKLLLAILSEGLNVNADALEKALGDEFRQMYLMNYYPPCPNPELVLGQGSHSDPCGLTVLFQNEVVGLHVKYMGNWLEINPLQNAFIVNIADQLEVLSNGIYTSVEHRVILKIGEKARISIATFCNPTQECEISPLAQLTVTNPPRYKSYLFSEYLEHVFEGYYDGKESFLNKLRLQNES